MKSVEYLLNTQCYKAAKLQHLIMVEYYTFQLFYNYIGILILI